MTDIPICIDISHWQNFPDFEEVAAAGVKGMIHKATEGTSYIDPNRAENCSNAIAAGIAVATYFWIKPGDGRAQAEFYLSVVDPVKGERVVIDFEEAGCSLSTLKDAVQALLDYKHELRITVYSGHLIKELLDDCDDFLAEHTDLWLAQYTDDEDDITWEEDTWPQWTLWQYSETGVIPGIDGSYVDLNQYNGTDDEFLEWISSEKKPPKPEPEPEPEPPAPPTIDRVVGVAIYAPEDVRVNVTVNNRLILRPRHQLRLGRRGPDIVR